MRSLSWTSVCVLCLAAPLWAKTVYDRRTPIVEVYDSCRAAVVNISGQRQIKTSIWPGFDAPGFFYDFSPRTQQQVPVLGSGFVIHADGYIVTNAHVIEGTDKIKVTFSNGEAYWAQVVNVNETKDLAVLHIEPNTPLPTIVLGRSHDLMIGETVVAIGNPFGYANTVTSGVVSAKDRDIHVGKGFWLRGLIQTDASINPGNSGGPLLNINGQLIGINTAIKADAENIGFAIPVDTLINNIRHMLMPEQLRRVRLGLVLGRTHKHHAHSGLIVERVTPKSPADQQGIREKDIILTIDGQPLANVIDFYVYLMDKEIGAPIQVQYIRPTEEDTPPMQATLTLVARPIPDGTKIAQAYFQMNISELNRAMARKFSFDSAYELLVISEVDTPGVAAEAGLQAGDLLLQVNHTAVTTMKEFSLAMEKVSDGQAVECLILRFNPGMFGQYVQRRYRVTLIAKRQKQPLYFF